MEDPIRSAPKSSNKGPIRTSKFSQKLSSLTKAIIHRKSKDDNAVVNKNPYPAQPRRDSKLYMSQPMLALSNPTSPDIDADDISDQSDRSSPINTYPAALQHHVLSHARKLSAQSSVSNSSFNGVIKTQPNSNDAGTANLCPSAIPLDTSRASDEDSLKPVVRELAKPPPLKPSKVKAVERLSTTASKQLPPIPAVSPSLSFTSSDDTVVPNGEVATSTPKVNKLYTSVDRPVMLMYSSTPALPTESSLVTIDGPNGIGRTNDNPPALSTLEEYPSSVRDVPKLTLNTTLDISNDSGNADAISTINTSSSQQPFFSPIQPRRTASSAPRLSLPPANYRFSLNLVDGYSARLSPSVILRPPPLPLLNLPVLSGSTITTLGEDGASSRRSRRAGLMSMPALPRQGSSRGVAGHEEFDDGTGDDDEEEDDGDGDGVDDDDNISPNSAALEDDVDIGYGSASETIPSSRSHSRTPSSTSSYETYETARPEPSTPREGYYGDLTRPPERRFSKPSYLPPVDMSHIDLSFMDLPPLDNKGKGKSKELTEDAGRTPTATTMWRNRNGGTAGNITPIASSGMSFFMPEETVTDTWPPSPVIMKGGQPSSPTLTPRPGGHFNFPLPNITPPSPPSARPLPTRLTTENRLSVSMNTISQFPETYKHASRSFVDVHALERKEKVEQMMREEEEGAELERKRRVKSMRMSMKIMVEGANATMTPLDQLRDAQSKTSPLSAVTKQMSLASQWVDGDAKKDRNPLEASLDASSAAAKTQPKRTSNRISMAPAYDTIIPLRRRLSMPTFNSTSTRPPPYPDLFPGRGVHAQTYGVKLTQIQPRDDEGQEKLPPYSNSIYLKAIMPRKVEFSQPGVQAKDRKWKRVLCVLEGTSFKVYKPPGISAIGGWWESKVGIGNMAAPITTTSSFNLGGPRQRVQDAAAGGAGGVIEESKAEVERERERMSVPSQFDGATLSNQRQGPSSVISGSPYSSSATPSSSSNAPPTSTSGVLPATKSALNLAVHLLKPSSRGHGRTISDVGRPSNTPVLRSPRSSLNIPMNGRSTPTPTVASGTSFSSSRSTSSMFASSSSLLTTPATSSSSHRSTNSSMSNGGGSAMSRTVANSYTTAAASSSSMSKGKKKAEDSDLLPDENSLIRLYTMQQAESGLGTDYVKRKHVIRVRLEGEQFLLQAHDVDSVIEWIEGLQAATNVAMDLDERLMPRGPLFPRRRRRRRVPATVDAAGVDQATPQTTGHMHVDALRLTPPLF